MILRTLEYKDIPGMLEWMHDEEVNKYFRFDAAGMTEENAETYIKRTWQEADEKKSYNFAVVDEADEYLGTISLKDVDWNSRVAEYAISLRKKAQGKGLATKATEEILRFAFEKLELNRVFLNVLAGNDAAISLYEKCGFKYEGMFRNHILIKGNLKSLKWYGIMKEEWEKENGKDNA